MINQLTKPTNAAIFRRMRTCVRRVQTYCLHQATPHCQRERECERERSSDCDADADSDTVVNRMTAPNNKVISSPNKTSARAPTRKAKAVRAGQQVRTSQRAGVLEIVCETERECSNELKPVRFEVGCALVVLR